MTIRRLRRAFLAGSVALNALAAPAFAQDTTTPPSADETTTGKEILVTGSRIKQDPSKSALPLEIIRTEDLSREGISSPEQLISFLAANGNGADNLASNSDVVTGAARGTNGLSSANLRGQGASATLVLLNGRRVAAHGLSGSAVDVNQIPLAAIERVEVLKDGASAIYGTDAIGGVINFITKKNFTGIDVTGFTDITQEGDSPIYRLSATAGWGKLDDQGFNIMASVSKNWNGALFGKDRDFVNGNQPNRGLSIDTRGTPIATTFPINATAVGIGIQQNGTLLGNTTGTLTNLTVNGVRLNGGVNVLDLPGGAGCGTMDGGLPYDEVLWNTPGAVYACAWDTGRAATLQQPIDTLTYYGRATARFGDHELYAEVTGSDAHSSKIFSNNQYTGNTTSLPISYPLNSLTAATYNEIYDRLAAVLPGIGAVGDRTPNTGPADPGRYGLPIAYRWRCDACGPRQYETDTKTFRAAMGLEGPIGGSFEYRIGGSYAQSQASSVLGSGYHYRGIFNFSGTPAQIAAQLAATGVPGATNFNADPRAPTAPGATAPGIVGLLNSGILNPFSLTQTPQALAALDAISAKGVRLYGGKYTVWQGDASISGDLFELPGGMVKIAAGVDFRREGYRFDGSDAGDETKKAGIFNVAFDNVNAVNGVHRTVKAAYAELLAPVFDMLELTAAARFDDYTTTNSSGQSKKQNTFNPKFTAKFQPADWIMARASYGTGFRVGTFNQIFNGVTQSPNPGSSLTDPTTCPVGGVVNVTPGCTAITPDSKSGGNLGLEPETSEQYSFGLVLRPTSRITLSADYWNIAVDNVIGSITIPQLFANIAAFPERIERTNGIITLVDLRTGNFGSRRTSGIDFMGRASFDEFGGTISAGFDATLLLTKKEKLLPNLPYTNLRGIFSLSGDLGLKWKHNAYVSWKKDGFTFTFSQIYRSSYVNFGLPNSLTGPNLSATRPDYNARVKPYIIYNMSASQKIGERFMITAGVKNLFNTDPPFAITYDSNTGSGSSWEPRVADPRGRSFTILAEVKF